MSIDPREATVLTFKVILVGDMLVGKTSLVRKYVEGFFSDNYRATIGADFGLKILKITDDCTVRLQLWDIAGQERFTSMTRPYFKNARGCVIMFDLTNERSFQRVTRWKQEIDDKCRLEGDAPVPCLLMGNKSDLESSRKISKEDIEYMCNHHDFLGWCETSVKQGKMVDEAMRCLVDEMIAGLMDETTDFTDSYTRRQNGSAPIKLTSDDHLHKPSKCSGRPRCKS